MALLLALFALSAQAQVSPDLALGRAWLEAQVQTDGTLKGEAASVATPMQARSEALYTLKLVGASAAPIASLLTGLDADTHTNTEYLARRAWALGYSGNAQLALIDKLQSRQNSNGSDGGYGGDQHYASQALDTAWVLLAQKTSAVSSARSVADALAYLNATQSADGYFAIHRQASVYATAQALLAAAAWRDDSSAASLTTSAQQWLLARRNPSRHFGNAFDNAMALWALGGQTSDAAILGPLVDALAAEQHANGSWNNDPYLSAIALRALFLVAQPPAPATTVAVSGKVLDGANASALAAVTVQILSGVQATVPTDAQGNYRFASVTPGTLTLRFSKLGYGSKDLTVTFSAGQNVNLGSISLVPMALTASLKGVVRNQTGTPLAGVTIAVGTASTLTDALGAYQIAGLSPGLATVAAITPDYLTVSAELTMVAGTSYTFSPNLIAKTATPPATTSVSGAVLDAATGQGLAGATVQLGALAQTSGTGGAFTFASTSAGAFVLTVSASGYQTISAAGVAATGANMVGNIGLSRVPASSVVNGTVTDAVTRQPIVAASVSVQGQGVPVSTGTDGKYSIGGLSGTTFTLSVSAGGYAAQSQSIVLSEPGVAVANVGLQLQGASTDISFVKVATTAPSYPASAVIPLELVLANSAPAGASVQVAALVLNAQDGVVHEYLGSPIMGEHGFALANNPLVVAGNSTLELYIDWTPLRLPAGEYRIKARAIDSAGRMAAEGETVFSVVAAPALAGGVSADPPLAQAGASTPIALTGDVTNSGNVPLPAGELQLRVTLEAGDNSPAQAQVARRGTLATGALLRDTSRLIRDGQGNLYTLNLGAVGKLVKIDASGAQTVLATLAPGATPSDLALDGAGNMWISSEAANQPNGKLFKVSPQGEITSVAISSLNLIYALDISDSGMTFLTGLSSSGETRLVQRDPAGTETVLWRNGLSQPVAMAKDGAGNYVVTNSADGSLVKVSAANGLISPFVSGLKQPKGITTDAAGNFYVASAGDNTVVKVSATGQTSVYASGFKQPYDLKFDGAGNLYVSNAGDHSLSKVLPNGTVELFSKSVANGPQAMKYDADGNLWIANQDGSLRKKDAQDNVGIVATGLNEPRGLAIAPNGDVFVAEYHGTNGKVSRIRNGVKTTFASGLAGPFGVASNAAGDVYVTEQSANRIARFDSAGNKVGATESLLFNPAVMRAGRDGEVHIKNTSSLSILRDGVLEIGLRTFPYSQWALDHINGGYIGLSGSSIFRVDAAGRVTDVKIGLPFTPYGVALDAAGNMILLDVPGKKLYRLDASGTLTDFVALPAYVNAGDLQGDISGNVFVRPNTGLFYQVAPSGALIPITHSVPDHIYGWSVGGSGKFIAWTASKTYRIDSASGATSVWLADRGYSGNGRTITAAAIDGAGNLILSDSGKQNVGVYTSAGIESKQFDGFAKPSDIVWTGSELRFVDDGGKLFAFNGSAYPTRLAGSLPVQYLAQSGGDTLGSTAGKVYKWTGTPGSGYDTYASISGNLSGIAASSNGSIAVAEYTSSRVLVLDSAKKIVRDYAGLQSPQGLAFDSAGRLYVANSSGDTIARFDSLSTASATTFGRVASPFNLAFDAAGQLLVTKLTGVDRLASDGVATPVTATGEFKGLLIDGAATLAVDQKFGQLRKLASDSSGNAWNVFAAGFAMPASVRAAANDEVFVLNRGNNTLVKYRAGKLGTVAALPAGMKSFDFAENGYLTVVGNSAIGARAAPNGAVSALRFDDLVDQRVLGAAAEGGNGKLYVMGNDRQGTAGTIFEFAVSQMPPPPPPGTVVHQASRAMGAMDADGSYEHVDFGNWVVPYGGDFKVEMWRDGVDGKIANFIHAGPHTQGLLTAAAAEVPPGDSTLAMCLDLKGADFTTMSRVEMGQVRAVGTSGVAWGMTADRSGNIYATDGAALFKTGANRSSTVIASGMELARGLAIDSQQNFYVASKNAASGRYELIRISLLGAKGVVADLGVTNASGVQVNSKDEVLVGSIGKVLKVDKQGVVSTVAVDGAPSPMGLAVDGLDNIYVQNTNNLVSMIKPNGDVLNLFSKADGVVDPIFEGDGRPTLAADCADNLYVAPYVWARINQAGEEHSIAQIVPRNGNVALLFDALKIDSSLTDLDHLAFDRFGNRLLVWNETDNSIWQVPVTCGAIGVQAHLVTRAGQTLTGASKPPSATVPLPDGRTEYVWSLRDVTSQGSQVCFGAAQNGVRLGEERKAIDSGFISFQNTFAPGDVTVPLAIPNVRGTNLVNMNVRTDLADYAALARAQVSTTLTNPNSYAVTGVLSMQVFDSQGALAGTVTQQDVTMAGGAAVPVTSTFDIGAMEPAQYKVVAVLNGANGILARAQTVFNVLPGNGSATARSTLATDRKFYNASDRVVVSSRVTNQSSNIVLENLTLMVQVYDGAGALRMSHGHAVVQLLPGASRDYSVTQSLLNLPPGVYTVRQTFSDSEGQVLDQPAVTYSVVSSALTGFGLTGSVTVAPKDVHMGDTLMLTASAMNTGNSGLADLPFNMSIIDPVAQTVVAEFPFVQSLDAGSSYGVSHNWIASGTVGRNYVALLTAAVGGTTVSLGQDNFVVSPAPVKLGISQNVTSANRVLVLVSCKAGESEVDQDGKPAPCITQRMQTIGLALTALGMQHAIVTDELAFRLAFRSGHYNTYWISGKEDKLPADLSAEVREAAFRGDGLMIDSEHDQRNKTLDSITGIRWMGKIGQTELPVNLAAPMFTAQRLLTVGRALKLDLAGGQQQAGFDGSMPASTGPAIISNRYGAGRTVLFAFDLAASLRAQADWQAVLAAALGHVLPVQTTTLTPGALLPVVTRMTNLAQATDIALTSTLPAGALYVGSNPASTYDTSLGSVDWGFRLALDQTTDVHLTFQLPPTDQPAVLRTVISTVKNGFATQYGEPLTLAINVAGAEQTGADALVALNAYVLTQNADRKLRDSLVLNLQSSLTHFKLGTLTGYELAIGELIALTDGLGGLTAVDTRTVHDGAGRILKEAQWRWAQLAAAQ